MPRFSAKPFQIATRILQLVKGGFNAFPNALEQLVKSPGVLLRLVMAFGRPDAITRLSANLKLPVLPKKTFISKDVTVADAIKNGFCRLTFVQIGRHQIEDNGQALQGSSG